MTKRLFSLLMILALAGGVLAGTPLRSSEKDCTVSKAMKCCKRKSAGHTTPIEITRANLCRTLACEQSASTASTVQLPQLSTLVVALLYFDTLKFSPAKQAKTFKTDFQQFSVSRYKNPLFLQHHALRI